MLSESIFLRLRNDFLYGNIQKLRKETLYFFKSKFYTITDQRFLSGFFPKTKYWTVVPGFIFS